MRLDIKAGDRFNRWAVVKEVAKRNNKRYFLCRCECGNTGIVSISNLSGGHSKSCRCYERELNKLLKTTHGGSKTRLYEIWSGMKKRCLNARHHAFKYYGGRGITVCEEWLNFTGFQTWAFANGYHGDLTIDRIDNDGNYDEGNCRWVPISAQNNNKSSSRSITFRGTTKTLIDWSRELGISYTTLHGRLRRGWPVESALTVPPKKEYSPCR